MNARSFAGRGFQVASAGACFVLFALACSGQQAQPNEPAGSPPAASAAPADTAASAEPAPTASEAAAAPVASAPPPESLVSLCNKMCDAVAPKCTKDQLEGCRVSCKSFADAPDTCDPSIRTALDCARQDRDFLFCSNVVPITCAKQFKAVTSCIATGEAPVEQVKKEIPDGWERFEAKGFSLLMPKGVQAHPEGGVEKWSVEVNGARYEVKRQAATLDKKLDNKYFLKLSRTLFGRCADKMKLHSIVEKPEETSIQFKVTCPENTEQVGRMHVVGSDLYVLTLTFPSGTKPEIDPFVYNLKTKK